MSSEDDINNLHQGDATYKPHSKRDEGDKAWQELANNTCATKTPSELEQLKLELAELDDKYKRLWADQQNMQKRLQREREETYKYAAVTTIEAILPALDNCEFALKSINANTKIEEVVKGIEMLKTQLMMSLQGIGLEEINTNGTYNAELHEAISSVQDSQKAEGSIVEVIKKGFKLRDKIIRPATVVVSTQQ